MLKVVGNAFIAVVMLLLTPQQVHSHDEPTAAELAKLYGEVGRELSALETQRGLSATIDLWPRYRWIRINDMLASPEKRHETWQLLEHLRADLH